MGDNSPVSLLAQRYASAGMREIFAPESKIISERKLWIAVMRAQTKLGHKIEGSVIADYEKVINKVDLASIDAREKQTRHDVKARIEEFNALAGHEAIHAGMTSRDLTENVEAMQIRDGLQLAHDRVVATLGLLGALATKYIDQPIAGRSHNVPAQITTLGKRFASAAEELLFAYERLDNLISRYPIRGIKGPVGTAQDSVDLLGSSASHAKLEAVAVTVNIVGSSITITSCKEQFLAEVHLQDTCQDIDWKCFHFFVLFPLLFFHLFQDIEYHLN